MLACIMRDQFGAKNPKSWMLCFHTQAAGVQLTAQQPEINLVRDTARASGNPLYPMKDALRDVWGQQQTADRF